MSEPPSSLPQLPIVDTDGLDARLTALGADAEMTAWALAFQRDGVGVIDLPPEALALCDAAIAQTDPWFEDPKVRRVQDVWRRAPAVRALAVHPKVLAYLAAAYGRAPFAFQTLNFKQGSQQPAHADAIHFHSEPPRFMCGVWLALEDVRAEAGPLFYHPGSHHAPVLTMAGAGVNRAVPETEDYGRHYVPALARRLEGSEQRQTLIRKGQALVWAANLAHGGVAIADPTSTRRSLVTHYYFKDCVYYTPMLSNPESGALHLRLPPNVATGGWVWPRRNGKRIALPWRAAAVTAWESLTRRVHPLG